MARDNGAVLHCSDSPQGRGDTIKDIDRWHKERGFGVTHNGKTYHVGYHYVILEDGTIQEGRPLDVGGAHARGYNRYVGICLIGIGSFTEAQFKSCAHLLEVLIRTKRITKENIIGHYAVSSKTCPNFNVDDFKLEYLS